RAAKAVPVDSPDNTLDVISRVARETAEKSTQDFIAKLGLDKPESLPFNGQSAADRAHESWIASQRPRANGSGSIVPVESGTVEPRVNQAEFIGIEPAPEPPATAAAEAPVTHNHLHVHVHEKPKPAFKFP